VKFVKFHAAACASAEAGDLVTEFDITQRAQEAAEELNLPFDSATASVRRPALFGALSGAWWVTSRVPARNAVTVIGVRGGHAWLVKTVYGTPAWLPLGTRLRFFAVQLGFGTLAGGLAYLLATGLAELPVIVAVPVAAFWGVLGAGSSVRFRRMNLR
jgi:hypothetical protein